MIKPKSLSKILFINKLMGGFFNSSGVLLFLVMLGIFVFIGSQTIPLFQGAKVEKISDRKIIAQNWAIVGIDEWGEKPFFINPKGEIYLVDLKKSEPAQKVAELSEDIQIKAMSFDNESKTLAYILEDGTFKIANIVYQPRFHHGERFIDFSLEISTSFSLFESGPKTVESIKSLNFGSGSQRKILGFILEENGVNTVYAIHLEQQSTLMGEGELLVNSYYDLTSSIDGQPQFIRISPATDTLVVTTQEGGFTYFAYQNSAIESRQTLIPFEEINPGKIASIEYLLGGGRLFLTHESGRNKIYSLYIPSESRERKFEETAELKKLHSSSISISKSLNNRAFVTSSGPEVSLLYATNGNLRWQHTSQTNINFVALTQKYEKLITLDDNNTLTLYGIHDPHPEGGLKSFFSRVWYEGFSKPETIWQSTGGSDTFEKKLSLIPLIFGTLKGAFYALIFALPIALSSAIYTSQFLDPKLRRIIKPLIEVMASLPSVIIGFMAALWFAPLVEDRIPSLLLILLIMPLIIYLVGYTVYLVPPHLKKLFPRGLEFIVLVPVIIFTSMLLWQLGPFVENIFFVVHQPETGNYVADFRLWWLQNIGMSFEQRNALVVGFMMGFAVIPIIYTLSDEALTTVPQSLKTGALALGASRWQSTWKVVLPAASAGIFSATMIGIGRAVGETMIVLMATGNTPIKEWNIFSGMRTLSANLAVELPEAPFHGTLYRTLFLGATSLIIMTFFINTLAEWMRQYLKKKYRPLA